MKIKFSKHALEQMERRTIPEKLVLSIIDHPDNATIQDDATKVYLKLVAEKSKFYFTEYL